MASPVLIASFYGSVSVVEYLLSQGANVNAVRVNLTNCVHYPTRFKLIGCVFFFNFRGATRAQLLSASLARAPARILRWFNFSSSQGLTFSSEMNVVNWATFFFGKGQLGWMYADIDNLSHFSWGLGVSCLTYSTWNPELCRYLLDHGAEVNGQVRICKDVSCILRLLPPFSNQFVSSGHYTCHSPALCSDNTQIGNRKAFDGTWS